MVDYRNKSDNNKVALPYGGTVTSAKRFALIGQWGEELRKRMLAMLVMSVALEIGGTRAQGQDPAKLPYMNVSLAPEERAADLVHRMTLEEKASQLSLIHI